MTEILKLPLPVTLKKYGLTEQDYIQIWVSQNGECPICGNPLSKRTNIDHFHVRGWKKLPADERKKYVRGILCFFCNKYYLGRSINVDKAKRVVKYLEQFEDKINACETKKPTKRKLT